MNREGINLNIFKEGHVSLVKSNDKIETASTSTYIAIQASPANSLPNCSEKKIVISGT